jgi:hypothetical protein
MGVNKSAEIHNQIIFNLRQELISLDYFVLWEYNYNLLDRKGNRREEHEADILAIEKQKRHAHIIEVKKSNTGKNRKDALRQLRADYRLVRELFKIEKIGIFYAYYNPKKHNLCDLVKCDLGTDPQTLRNPKKLYRFDIPN